jgi:hypothetical protein
VKKPYHIVSREEKRAAAAIEQFAKSNGPLLLPLVELIIQARVAVDEVIGSIGCKTIETILMLSADEVAGARTPGKSSGDIRWHGSQSGQVALADRQIESEAGRVAPQTGGRSESAGLPSPARQRGHGRAHDGRAVARRFHASVRRGSAGDGGHGRRVAQ